MVTQTVATLARLPRCNFPTPHFHGVPIGDVNHFKGMPGPRHITGYGHLR